jgi:hypothetical protein
VPTALARTILLISIGWRLRFPRLRAASLADTVFSQVLVFLYKRNREEP